MPLSLEPRDVSSDLEDIRSVLIVSCPVCPPVSLAMEQNSPLIDLFKSGLKTRALEEHIKKIREPLEQKGIRTGVFSMYAPLPTMCLWTKGQRNRLLRRARDYEAVLVLGCDSAAYTAQQALREADCRVVQGMRTVGITNAAVKFRLPMKLELEEKTRVEGSTEAKAETQHRPG